MTCNQPLCKYNHLFYTKPVLPNYLSQYSKWEFWLHVSELSKSNFLMPLFNITTAHMNGYVSLILICHLIHNTVKICLILNSSSEANIMLYFKKCVNNLTGDLPVKWCAHMIPKLTIILQNKQLLTRLQLPFVWKVIYTTLNILETFITVHHCIAKQALMVVHQWYYISSCTYLLTVECISTRQMCAHFHRRFCVVTILVTYDLHAVYLDMIEL